MGAFVGSKEGLVVGDGEGSFEGWNVGFIEGSSLGMGVGRFVEGEQEQCDAGQMSASLTPLEHRESHHA